MAFPFRDAPVEQLVAGSEPTSGAANVAGPVPFTRSGDSNRPVVAPRYQTSSKGVRGLRTGDDEET